VCPRNAPPATDSNGRNVGFVDFEIADRAMRIADRTSGNADRALEIADKTSIIADRTLEIADKFPRIAD